MKLFWTLTGALFASLAFMLWATPAQAQGYECDDRFGACGTPDTSGGGGCGCGCGCSILVAMTDLGDTYQYADDYDDDGLEDPYDNCAFAANPDQTDGDGDGAGDACDNCPAVTNVDQADLDGNGEGDACDADLDGDSVPNGIDICSENPDPNQKDEDADGLGNACDPDMDNDGIPNLEDNCALVANPDQAQDDPGRYGAACDDDDDGDGIRNTLDNCPQVVNLDQLDGDGDGIGDKCDADMDQDGVVNISDNCPRAANELQTDTDRDGKGEQCDERFCYVVMGDLGNCLDPTDAFAVYSPPQKGETGEEIRLRLFANRMNEPLRYTWQIVEAPGGSSATVDNPTGSANVSTPVEYHYLKNRNVTITPDKPGTYRIKVMGHLVWEDPITGNAGSMAEAYAIVEVEGESLNANGCSMAPNPNPKFGLLHSIVSLL